MKPINSIEEALKTIEAHRSNANDLELPISDEFQDPMGMNMAMITDAILAKGWEPDGFIQENGYKIYLFKEMESF